MARANKKRQISYICRKILKFFVFAINYLPYTTTSISSAASLSVSTIECTAFINIPHFFNLLCIFLTVISILLSLWFVKEKTVLVCGIMP